MAAPPPFAGAGAEALDRPEVRWPPARDGTLTIMGDVEADTAVRMKHVTVHTDGACSGNPGPGGWAAILVFGPHRRELSGAFQRTTNNRMELMACIHALEILTEPCRVRLHSDSRYVVEAIEKGWALRWRANGWRRGKQGPAKNPDLWARLLELCAYHDVRFVWVKGHAGDIENERADELSTQASRGACGLPDTGFAG